MELAEIKRRYAIELNNNVNINSEQTIKSYISAFNKFISEKSRIYRLTKQDLKEYLGNIRFKYSDSYYNVIGSSLKIIYIDVLNQPNKISWFKAIKTKQKFHDIISFDEFIEMGKKCKNIKHKLIHVLLFSTGIRRSELLNIKLHDIDWQNDRIYINSAKNCKNGYVPLHNLTKKYLLKYMRGFKPKVYLLNGQKSLQYSASSLNAVVKNISNGKYSCHSYRHTFLTNFIEHENVFSAKEIARHSNLSSILHYYHIPKDKMRQMYNPLNEIA